MPLEIFISYPRNIAEQRRYLDNLRAELSPLEHEGLIKCFDDRNIMPGDIWEDKLEEKLRDADMVLLLLSPAFYDSAWCLYEKKIALDRRQKDHIDVIPILVEKVDLDKDIGRIQSLPVFGLPANLKPVSQWQSQDEAWRNVVHNLRKKIEQPETRDKRLELRPFGDVVFSLKQAIKNADHLWLLCRTGLGLWKDFGAELDQSIERAKEQAKKATKADSDKSLARTRLIFAESRGEAFLSTRHQFVPWYLEARQTFDQYQAEFEKRYRKLYSKANKESIKTLNMVFPLTVLIVNPHAPDRETVMFIEYPTIGSAGKLARGEYQEKPWAVVTPQEYSVFYQGFHDAFKTLWDNARKSPPAKGMPT